MVALALVLAVGGSVAPFDVEAWRKALIDNRVRFANSLQNSPNSSLAAVQRVDFGDAKELVVGSAPDAAVRLEDPGVKPHHLRVTAEAEGFSLAAIDAGATFRTKAGEVREAKVPPSAVTLGRYTIRLSHQGFPAIIVFDPQSPRLKHGPTPAWFAPDEKFRLIAKLERDPKPAEIVIQSTRGNRRKALKLGRFVFEVDGRQLSLEANRLLEPGGGENDVSVFFRDATTGQESYPVGRYVDPTHNEDDTWTLDFNAAYNPACAWSDFYNCPIPPRANTLPIAIHAGEKPPVGGAH